jgi:hypothetical protein
MATRNGSGCHHENDRMRRLKKILWEVVKVTAAAVAAAIAIEICHESGWHPDKALAQYLMSIPAIPAPLTVGYLILIGIIVLLLFFADHWLVPLIRTRAGTSRKGRAETNADEYHSNKAQLMSFYIEAGELLKNFPFPEDIGHREQRIKEVNDFFERTSSWIGTNMGPISQARFLDFGSEGTDGNATEWKLKLRRRNLSRLIESDHWG